MIDSRHDKLPPSLPDERVDLARDIDRPPGADDAGLHSRIPTVKSSA